MGSLFLISVQRGKIEYNIAISKRVNIQWQHVSHWSQLLLITVVVTVVVRDKTKNKKQNMALRVAKQLKILQMLIKTFK